MYQFFYVRTADYYKACFNKGYPALSVFRNNLSVSEDMQRLLEACSINANSPLI